MDIYHRRKDMREYGGFQLIQALVDADEVPKASDVGSELTVEGALQMCKISANPSSDIMILVQNVRVRRGTYICTSHGLHSL